MVSFRISMRFTAFGSFSALSVEARGKAVARMSVTAASRPPPEARPTGFEPSDGSVRTIALPKTVCDLLASHLAPAGGRVGSAPDALVSTTPSGLPVSQGNFYQRVFKPAVTSGTCTGCGEAVTPKRPRAADCEDGTPVDWTLPPSKHGLRFHDLRHTCASLSLSVCRRRL